MEGIRSGEWKSVDKITELDEAKVAELKLFSKVQHELTVDDEGSIIMRGLKIVLSSKLRRRAINIAHEGHQGIVKTKQLLREKVWFPGIDKEVQEVHGWRMHCLSGKSNR